MADNPKDLIEKPWTRKEVAAYLGKSDGYVRDLERQGKLHPELGPPRRGGFPVNLFDPSEVRRFAAVELKRGLELSPGEMTAEIFYAFDRGASLTEIVEHFHIDPEKVKSLYHEWKTPDLEKMETSREAEILDKKMRADTPDVLALMETVKSPLLAANKGTAEDDEIIFPALRQSKPSPIPNAKFNYRPIQARPLVNALFYTLTEMNPDVLAMTLVTLAKNPKLKAIFDSIGKSIAQIAGQFEGKENGKQECPGSVTTTPENDAPTHSGEGLDCKAIQDQNDGSGGCDKSQVASQPDSGAVGRKDAPK